MVERKTACTLISKPDGGPEAAIDLLSIYEEHENRAVSFSFSSVQDSLLLSPFSYYDHYNK
jgi:hypothetical protein